jgi:hypothetical protein
MKSDMWRSLCDQIPSEATPNELDEALSETEVGTFSEDERAALWLYVWSRAGRAQGTAARLRADARPSASRAMIRYLAVLIRTNVASPRPPDSAYPSDRRAPASVSHEDHAAD